MSMVWVTVLCEPILVIAGVFVNIFPTPWILRLPAEALAQAGRPYIIGTPPE